MIDRCYIYCDDAAHVIGCRNVIFRLAKGLPGFNSDKTVCAAAAAAAVGTASRSRNALPPEGGATVVLYPSPSPLFVRFFSSRHMFRYPRFSFLSFSFWEKKGTSIIPRTVQRHVFHMFNLGLCSRVHLYVLCRSLVWCPFLFSNYPEHGTLLACHKA
ncbi:hypothetical protein BS78_03G002600 [Paspalum vaginatum]|nr:hypothetical protein BS78_03G002600 [Paspalum vaginatum]